MKQRMFDGRRRSFRSPLAGVALAVLAAAAAPVARADVTFTVDTTDDRIDDDVSDGICHTSANTCALRAALMQSNYLSGPILARIVLPAGTYGLTRPATGTPGETNGDLDLVTPSNLNQRVEIAGAGAATTVIDATQIDRVLNVGTGRIVSLSDVTLRNGLQVAFQGGGGILNRGALTIRRCVIERSSTEQSGGGAFNLGAMSIIDSRIAANSAYLGGGIANQGTLLLLRSSVVANSASGGGALYNIDSATIRDSTLSGNSALVDGGAIITTDELYVVNSTLSGNFANGNGGAIVQFGVTRLYNSSVIDNDADHDRDETGGIGGGVFATTGGSNRFIVVNSLIARNTILDAPIEDDCSGRLETAGRNLFSRLVGCTFTDSSAVGLVAPESIGPLQDNGGPTATHALLAGSAAVNGTVQQATCIDETGTALITEQRGAPRTAGARCDVGAFEFGSAIPAPLAFANGFE